MVKLKFNKPFKWARDGVHIMHFVEGVHEVDDRCAELALELGYAEKMEHEKPHMRKRGKHKE